MTDVEDWVDRLRSLWGETYALDSEDIRMPTARRALALRADAAAEVLGLLAADPAAEVRQAIAANPSAPDAADHALAADADTEVRCALAAKISRLVAGLDAQAQDAVRRKAIVVLETLVRDQTARVRQIIAETLKEVAHAPPEVIRRLARDAETAVSCPVLEYSPILTDQDLLEIIAGNPASDRLGSISRRKTVTEPVADAVIRTGDDVAVGMLLANPNAMIREVMLDYLIDLAPSFEAWHKPLVGRPALPAAAAARLARFVAENLLEALAERRDLPADALAEVRQVVKLRLAGSPAADGTGRPGPAVTPEDAMKTAQEHQAAGHLDERTIAEAVRTGDREFVIAALALCSHVPVAAIRKVVAGHDPRGMLAVAWKAGLSAKLAELLQQRLAAVAPDDVIRAAGQKYAMAADALAWQVDFMKNSA